jgi:hypothetical protein
LAAFCVLLYLAAIWLLSGCYGWPIMQTMAHQPMIPIEMLHVAFSNTTPTVSFQVCTAT